MSSKPLMKLSLAFSLLGAFALLTACEDEPPVRPTRHPSRYPAATPSPYPPPTQPYNDPNAGPPPPTSNNPPPEPAPQPTAATVNKPTKGDLPYGIPEIGRAHV